MRNRRSWLHHLDAALVPRARGALRRVGAALGRPWVALVGWERSEARPLPVRRVATRPAGVALMAAVVVFVGSVVHLQRFDAGPDVEDEAHEQAVTQPGESAPAEVGPRVGADLDLYVDGRREALRELDRDLDIRAVVSFDDYESAEDLDLPDGVEIERLELRVPAEGEPPRSVEVDAQRPGEEVGEVVADEVAGLEEEEDELRSLLESDVDDPAFEEEFARRAEEIGQLRETLEAEAAIVYAVVVTGPVEALVSADEAPGVRLVDPVGAVAETRSTRVFGLLPEDLDRASHGRAL